MTAGPGRAWEVARPRRTPSHTYHMTDHTVSQLACSREHGGGRAQLVHTRVHKSTTVAAVNAAPQALPVATATVPVAKTPPVMTKAHVEAAKGKAKAPAADDESV